MKHLYLIILSVFFLSSCINEEQFDNTPEGNMEALWKMIDEHYCFLDYKAEAIGLDWNEVHGRYRQMLDKDMTSPQLQEEFLGCLVMRILPISNSQISQ